MKVKELKEILDQFPENAEVMDFPFARIVSGIGAEYAKLFQFPFMVIGVKKDVNIKGIINQQTVPFAEADICLLGNMDTNED